MGERLLLRLQGSHITKAHLSTGDRELTKTRRQKLGVVALCIIHRQPWGLCLFQAARLVSVSFWYTWEGRGLVSFCYFLELLSLFPAVFFFFLRLILQLWKEGICLHGCCRGQNHWIPQSSSYTQSAGPDWHGCWGLNWGPCQKQCLPFRAEPSL